MAISAGLAFLPRIGRRCRGTAGGHDQAGAHNEHSQAQRSQHGAIVFRVAVERLEISASLIGLPLSPPTAMAAIRYAG